ncbi:hypothetical protein [Deinococcus pimensis]|uniref:hypothetical protein n=1 Tax=Deinococcus pimensis TaxID=309888 RepID=UPI0004842BBD|nr:hypothetical protein [Deinococcus pimensis]
MESVVALFNEPNQARQALANLLERGYSRDHLAFSLLDPVTEDQLARETGVSPEEGAPAGSGAVMRGAWLGLLAGVGLAVPTWLLLWLIPEARVYHEGGLLGIMFGAIAGLGLGGFFGALSGGDHGDYVKLLVRMGVPERIALSYYDALKQGKVMVIARDQDAEMADQALAVMKGAGAIALDERAGGGRLQSERVTQSESRHR